MRKIFFDIETRNTFQEVGSNEPSALDISIVGVYDSSTDTYSSYTQETLKNLWPILESADILVSFNGIHFDIPILNKYYSGDLTRIHHVDLLAEVRNSLGRRIKLDTLAEATLGMKKSGHGLDAITWWREGKIDLIIKYCLDDVKITKDLYEYALTNKYLKYTDLGKIKEIPLKTDLWEKSPDSSLTFTLPF